MNISITNLTTYLTTLTLTQLKKELNRVSSQYQGAQIRFLSDTSYEGWQKHISLIEEEIEQRSKKGTKNMNATNTQTTTTTVQQADTLIENIGMTDMVEDYEENELGHVYQLTDNSTIVVTSSTTFQFFGTDEQ